MYWQVNSWNIHKKEYIPWTPHKYFEEIGTTLTLVVALVRESPFSPLLCRLPHAAQTSKLCT